MATKLAQSVKASRKGENLGDPIDKYILDYVSMFFSNIFIKLHIIPNVITLLSGLVGVAGGILLIFDTLALNIVGVVLIIFSVIFDVCDGQVARLTKRYSNFGRTLDGLMDSLVYVSIYVALCFRLFSVNIPFTNTPWGWWIVLVAAVSIYFHSAQSHTVDFYKNLHLYMSRRGNELSRSADVEKEIAATKKHSFEAFRLKMYLSYTKTQEKESPETQKLLRKIDEVGGVTPQLSDVFLEKSRKYVPFTNLLTFNLRTIILFVLLFLPGAAEFYFFPVSIVALEIARIVIIVKYEKFAKSLCARQELFENVTTEESTDTPASESSDEIAEVAADIAEAPAESEAEKE